jgi:hypothetical protein
VTFRGTASSTTTASNSGSYTFTGLTNGTYVVTPTNSGYAFSPASQQVIINIVNATEVNVSVTIEQDAFCGAVVERERIDGRGLQRISQHCER